MERDGAPFCKNVRGREKHKEKCYGLKQVSRFLTVIQTCILDYIMTQDLEKHFLSIFSAYDTDINRCTMESVLEAYFCGKVASNWQKLLSQLSCDFYYKAIAGENASEVLHLVDECFVELHRTVTGLPVSSSRILEGLVLQRDFAVYCPSVGDKRVLIVTEPIHTALSDLGVEVVITAECQYQVSELWITKRTEAVIRHMQHNNIKVLLSSVKQEEVVHYCAKNCGISIVECLSLEEISLICRITGISPFRPSQDSIHTGIAEAAVAKFCQPLRLGAKGYVHIGLSGTDAFQPHSIILCGAVHGVTEQHACAFHGAFKMLRQMFVAVECCEPLSESQDLLNTQQGSAAQQQFVEEPTNCENIPAHGKQLILCEVETEKRSLVSTAVGAKELAGSHTHLNNSSCITMPCADLEPNTVCSLLNESEKYIVDLQKLPPEYKHPGKTGVDENEPSDDNQCIHITVEEGTCSRHALVQLPDSKDSFTGPSHGPSIKDGRNNKSCAQSNAIYSIKAGALVPVGGIFEILLHYYLSSYAKQCQSTSTSVLCSLIADVLLSVPKTLCRTQKRNAFAQLYLEVTGALRSKQQLLLTNQKSLESVSCKYQLVASVLQCAAKLLNIDLIVGIKRLPQKNVESDSEGDL
ncbi:Bardet-Biedl syndrome 10 protein isoform X2 [Eublepharis macularius]|nr:Bardet-Biedl syndrome 10 protein isoform X2 [Eublepharis macularius]